MVSPLPDPVRSMVTGLTVGGFVVFVARAVLERLGGDGSGLA